MMKRANRKKSNKCYFKVLSVILVIVFCFSIFPAANTYAADGSGNALLQKQSFFPDIIKKIFSNNPVGVSKFGIKEFLSLALGIGQDDDEMQNVLNELDEIKETQNEMMSSLKNLQTMVECEQLNSIINSFNDLKDEWAPKIVYDSLLEAEQTEDPVQRTAEEKSYLLGGLGIDATSPLINNATVPFDTYVEEFGKAISGPYQVTFTGSNGTSTDQGDIFWIYEQSKMRDPNTKWEHLATEDMAQFYINTLGNYTLAAIIDLLSLNARIDAVADYNSKHAAEEQIGDKTIRDRFSMLMTQMENIVNIADEWEVEEHDEYKHLWVPGHDVRIYPDAITKQQPVDKDESWHQGPHDVGYDMEYCESMTSYDEINQEFWAPLFQYNDSSVLINYDQVNKILDAYSGQTRSNGSNWTLYSILKEDAGISFPDNLTEDNSFMLNPEPGHELDYRDYKTPAGDTSRGLFCYICPGNAENADETEEVLLQEVAHWKSKFLGITTDKVGRVYDSNSGIDYVGIGYYGGGNGDGMDLPLYVNNSTIEQEEGKHSTITVSWKAGTKKALDVTLKGNGIKAADFRITADDNWTQALEWEDAVDEQGNPIAYTLAVKTPDGYKSTVSGDIESGFLVTLKKTLVKSDVTLKTSSYTYNGKAKKPAVTVKSGTKTLKKDKDYTVSYKNNINAGTAAVIIKGKGGYTGTVKATYKISKAANPLKTKVSSKVYTAKDLTGKVTFTIGATKGQGSVTYTRDTKAKNAGISVTKTGIVKIPKNCKVGTYRITVKAAGNNNYKAGKKVVTIKVK